jgi:acylphosphatase
VSEPERACRRFLISGHVQGVFFRASTAREAARLGLVGWARNLADGRVEVLAAGRADAVEALGRWLHGGPPAATVRAVEEFAPIEPDECDGLSDFRTG